MSSSLFSLYKQCLTKLEVFETKSKKAKGAAAAELLKREIEKLLKDEPYKVSAQNSYIKGSSFEYDLLIVKKSAKPYLGLIYEPEDVIAVLECKSNGLAGNIQNAAGGIAKAFNAAYACDPKIHFGYITYGEKIPVNEFNSKTNEPTHNQWKETISALKETEGSLIAFPVTLYKRESDYPGNVYCECSDNDFKFFVGFLIGKDRGRPDKKYEENIYFQEIQTV